MADKKVNLADKEKAAELLKQLYGDSHENTQIAKDGEKRKERTDDID